MKPVKLKLLAPWEEVKERIKERNIEITDEDLVYQPGKEDQLLQQLAKKMDRSPEAVKAYIESISYNKDIAS